MSDSVIITTIFMGLAVAVLAIGLHRLRFRKSIVFYISSIMMVPIVFGPIGGLIVGARGMIHFAWAMPLLIILTSGAYEIIARILQKPMNEMVNKVDALAVGDVEVVFDEKFQKGKHELAKVMRQLVKLAESLKNVAVFANHVGKGKLDSEYTLLGEMDSLGKAMLDMRANLQQAEAEKEARQLEDERRNWITQGIARFAGLLRANNDSIEELCQSVITNLVKYIGANQGGIFILNDDDVQNPVLELKACYAYERRKFLEKTIESGEGLVGTCFLEGQSIYMNDLPKNYINITSGLGEDTPRALLLVPLKVNEKKYGIIEIAAFREFEPHVREFAEKVSESIASTIGSVKVNVRTNQLLAKSKIQAEEMANQEEELRQNMEEMQATQEEMRRREAELQMVLKKSQNSENEFREKVHWYEALLDAFEETPISVTDMNKNLTFLNKAALTILGTTREATMGKYCGDVWNVDICKDERCGIEYLKCNKGKSEFQVGDNIFTTLASYIKDSEGNNIGHIEVVNNVTGIVNK